MRPRRIGFLIPEFPQQTHIAWWRISEGMRLAGARVELLSTRRPVEACPHPQLRMAAENTTYLWPPKLDDLSALPVAIRRFPAIAGYLGSLATPRGAMRLRAGAFVAAAARLFHISRRHDLDHVFVHSCADAAHVAAMCRLLGGPDYSLRLGGDLEVYGGDHKAKMAGATLIVPAARSYVARLVEEVGVAPERILWSWVGTDVEHFRPGVNRTATGALRIVTVARLNSAKGYQFAIPALAMLRDQGVDFRYRLIGGGPFEGQIRALVTEYRLSDRIELMGSRSADEIALLLRDSDIFMLPTSGIGEGTPAAVCEAMSAGLPIIGTKVGGLADMVTDGLQGFLVPPGDAQALHGAMLRLAQDRALAARMGEAARAKAVAEFDFRVVAGRILDTIGQLGSGIGPQSLS